MQIPFRLENEDPSLFLRQEYGSVENKKLERLPPLVLNAPNGEPHSLTYGGQAVGSHVGFSDEGEPLTHQIPYKTNYDLQKKSNHLGLSYGDPRRKRSLSMVKKLVRVNAKELITPIEFSIEDLRLFRIRQQLFIQIEPVNQMKLQITNFIRERFEQIFQLKTNKESPILKQMEPESRRLLKQYITDVLDAVAHSVGNGLGDRIRNLEDLQAIIDNPKVRETLSKIEGLVPGGMDLRLRNILEDTQERYKKSIESKWVQGDTIAITDEQIRESIEQSQSRKKVLKNMHARRLKTLKEVTFGIESEVEDDEIYIRHCKKHQPINTYYDPDEKKDSSIPGISEIDRITKAYIPFETGVFDDDYSHEISRFSPFKNHGEQFFEAFVSDKNLQDLLMNDFTQTPAFATVSDFK